MGSNARLQSRLQTLRKVLIEGKAQTQEEIREALEKSGFEVNQSTVSRDLRKVEAIKATDSNGRTIYRLSEDSTPNISMIGPGLNELILNISHNEHMIVIHTTPGSASLLARHLDRSRPANLLGTIAGDDTIFVAPAKGTVIKKTISSIRDSFQNI